jgi:hypothetical protein
MLKTQEILDKFNFVYEIFIKLSEENNHMFKVLIQYTVVQICEKK